MVESAVILRGSSGFLAGSIPAEVVITSFYTGSPLNVKIMPHLWVEFEFCLILVNRLRKIIATLEDEKSILTTEWNHMRSLVDQVILRAITRYVFPLCTA